MPHKNPRNGHTTKRDKSSNQGFPFVEQKDIPKLDISFGTVEKFLDDKNHNTIKAKIVTIDKKVKNYQLTLNINSSYSLESLVSFKNDLNLQIENSTKLLEKIKTISHYNDKQIVVNKIESIISNLQNILYRCDNTILSISVDDLLNLSQIKDDRFDKLLTMIQHENSVKQETISKEQKLIYAKMEDLKIPDDVIKKIADTNSLEDIDILLKGALNNGKITKFDYDRINSHTTNSKNEIMFDIVDMIIEIIGKKKFWKFLSYAPTLNRFVLTYEKYIKIVLNTLIVIIIGGLVGGYLSSRYFSGESNNMIKQIDSKVSTSKKMIYDLNQAIINFKKPYINKYKEVKNLDIKFGELSTDVTSVDGNDSFQNEELSEMIKDICEKYIIDKVFIAGFATGAKIEENKNINYDDNFDLSLARANSIKYKVYSHCQNMQNVEIVNLVMEKSEKEEDQKAVVKFFTKKRDQ